MQPETKNLPEPIEARELGAGRRNGKLCITEGEVRTLTKEMSDDTTDDCCCT